MPVLSSPARGTCRQRQRRRVRSWERGIPGADSVRESGHGGAPAGSVVMVQMRWLRLAVVVLSFLPLASEGADPSRDDPVPIGVRWSPGQRLTYRLTREIKVFHPARGQRDGPGGRLGTPRGAARRGRADPVGARRRGGRVRRVPSTPTQGSRRRSSTSIEAQARGLAKSSCANWPAFAVALGGAERCASAMESYYLQHRQCRPDMRWTRRK